MEHKYNIPALLASIVGYKGIPFPGGFLPPRPVGNYAVDGFEVSGEAPAAEELIKGTRLRRQGANGVWYFMPVYFRHPSIGGRANARNNQVTDNTLELSSAIISVTGQKTIVETPMVGRKGSIKELISLDDYEISIAAFLHTPGRYPEPEITQIRNLYNINESVELISVLTDLVIDEGDRVVITDIEYPSTPGIEDGQAVRLKCRTDKEFELFID